MSEDKVVGERIGGAAEDGEGSRKNDVGRKRRKNNEGTSCYYSRSPSGIDDDGDSESGFSLTLSPTKGISSANSASPSLFRIATTALDPTPTGSSSSTTTSTTTIATQPPHFLQDGFTSAPALSVWCDEQERRDHRLQPQHQHHQHHQPSSSSTLPSRINYSVNESAAVKCKAKIARFYSQDTTCGGELRVIEPLLLCGGNRRSGSGIVRGSGRRGRLRRENTTTSLAAIWGAPNKQQSTIRKLNSVRKPSSWEESVLVERRRSLAAAVARGWKLERGIGVSGGGTGTTGGSMIGGLPPLHHLTTAIDTKDLRYCFQHPYLRLFTTLLVTFCNFLLFAEDPISHSQAESVLPLAGNVFSFIFTKYPRDWRWALVKVLMWILAILCGLVVGKLFVHNIIFGRLLRLKMFRDEQGSWIAMFLTVILSVYTFSYIYNFVLYIFYNNENYIIDSSMGVTNSAVMKACACGTWLGDLITWLMVMDVMLQDNLYPDWAVGLRKLWRSSNLPRILVFWCGSALATTLVVTLIVSDYISWDTLNRDFVASTELSRAFLASLILVLDLVIMMQDWDFPHFTATVHINLPGFSVSTLKWKYAEVNLTGKWFNYGVIFLVMMLDLNMWKNQIFYYPSKFGQYIGPNNKIHTVVDQSILKAGNVTLWSWEFRSKINQTTGLPYYQEDMKMNSMFLDYPLTLKCTAFIPSIVTLSLFISLVYLYGRFPHKKDVNGDTVSGTGGGISSGGVGNGNDGDTVTV